MWGKQLSKLIAVALTIAYVAVLAMSAGHLAHWYAATLGPLPQSLAWGLAASLEAVAFLLSITSNVLPKASRWASPGSIAALALVWAGNYLSMHRFAQNEIPAWEIALASSFVPVGTYVVGKVIGELVKYSYQETLPSLPPDLTLLARDLLTSGDRVQRLQAQGVGKPAIAQAIVAYIAGNPSPYERLKEVESKPIVKEAKDE